MIVGIFVKPESSPPAGVSWNYSSSPPPSALSNGNCHLVLTLSPDRRRLCSPRLRRNQNRVSFTHKLIKWFPTRGLGPLWRPHCDEEGSAWPTSGHRAQMTEAAEEPEAERRPPLGKQETAAPLAGDGGQRSEVRWPSELH